MSKVTKKDTLLDKIHDEKTSKGELKIDEMPLNSLGDYLKYNEVARKENKRLGLRRYPIKQCPVELHPKQRIIFSRVDQPTNPLPVFLSNHMIEFKDKLIPGRTYDLALCVIDYLAKKGTPVYDMFDLPNGDRISKEVSRNPRFALRNVYS